jgi:hypothetical protein
MLNNEPNGTKSPWPLAILGTLLFALSLFSKRHQSREPITPHDSSASKYPRTTPQPSLISNIAPINPNEKTTEGSKKRTPFWEKAAVLVALGLLIVNICQMRSTEKAAEAAETANINAKRALNVSEQARVSIGRPDGTVAEILIPKVPNDKAGLIIYFQNTGHLPAKFNWGVRGEIVDTLQTKPCCFWWKTDRTFSPMWRAKDKKTGQISWSGTTTIGGNSQYESTVGEIPRQQMLQLMEKDPPLAINGTYEYCDAMHNYQCRNFSLWYRHEPYNRFMLINEDECMGFQPVILNPKPELEYLSPCATGSEREEVVVPKGLTPIQH